MLLLFCSHKSLCDLCDCFVLCFLHFSFCFMSKIVLWFLNSVVIQDIKNMSAVYLQNLHLMNNKPSVSLDHLRTSSSSSITSRYLVYIFYTALRKHLLIVNFHIFWIEYKNAFFTSFTVQGDKSKSTLMTPSSTSSDEQQKKLVTRFERQPYEKTPPPAEPSKDCTGPVVMAIPAPKQGGSLI